MANGQAWKTFNPLAKAVYVMGYCEGVGTATQMIPNVAVAQATQEILMGTGLKLNNGKTADALDRFFDDPLNMPITLLDAIWIVVEQARGESPRKVDEDIRRFRKQANETPK
jgi:hypothetical protein